MYFNCNQVFKSLLYRNAVQGKKFLSKSILKQKNSMCNRIMNIVLEAFLLLVAILFCVILLWHFNRKIKEPKLRLNGGKVLITGGSKGIGFWAAHASVKKGASVCIVARNEEILKEAREELLKHRIYDSQEVLTVACDVSKFEPVKQAITNRFKQSGWDSLDGLVCNAGVESVGTFTDLDVSEHRQVMDINYFGAVNVIKTCLPYLKNNSKKGSRVVVNSSLLGLTGMMCYSAYSASKYALRGLVESIAQELRAYNIHCCLIFPPDVDTDQYKREKQVNIPKQVRDISSGSGLFRPEDIGKDITGMIENGGFSASWGVDGWMLRNLTAGMTPAFSFTDTIAQVCLSICCFLFTRLLLVIVFVFNACWCWWKKKDLVWGIISCNCIMVCKRTCHNWREIFESGHKQYLLCPVQNTSLSFFFMNKEFEIQLELATRFKNLLNVIYFIFKSKLN
ncbi:3-ketodihydrosphingosine reductase precursor [Reticulomyxa filosa]|uniref:3-ketodihydrosphingosine reductase n=1 Tax=Reticulomyxa filosa TaxID=46433 RepID=X6P3J1_RETFI|nr:3-ketodihydrosphingosine reductase precursor [Reticulomyxa filosa]|eukprot:ETO32654.1 3-ketodihydrosphingosine reductase precursor [Reticulomyxa filosa]